MKELREPQRPRTTKSPLENHIESFLIQADIKTKTKETYRKSLRAFFNFLADERVNEPQKAHIVAFKEKLQDEGKKATTIQTYLIAIKVFFKYLDSEMLYRNIAQNVKNVRIEKNHKKDFLNVGECKELLQSIETNTLKGARDYAIISLMLTCGLRTVEIARANIEDIKSLNGQKVLYIQGKGRDEKSEYVKINFNVYGSIQKYLMKRLEQHPQTNEKEPLFSSTSNNNSNGRITTRALRELVKKHLRRIDLDSERLTAHSLRHTSATLNLLNGGTLEETQQLLRHTNINTTMIYVHTLERLKNQSENRIASAIFE